MHADSFAPKVQSVKWFWDKNADRLHFQQHFDLDDAKKRFAGFGAVYNAQRVFVDEICEIYKWSEPFILSIISGCLNLCLFAVIWLRYRANSRLK